MKKHERYSCLWGITLMLFACMLILSSCSDEILDTSGSSGVTPGDRLELPSGNDDMTVKLDPSEETTDLVLLPDKPTDPEELLSDAEHTLRADFLNTGKSDAMVFRMDGKVIMIDTGDSDDYGIISARLDELKISTIDVMIITHFDNDHIGSAAKIIENYTVKEIYAPDYVRTSSRYNKFIDAVDKKSSVTTLEKLSSDKTFAVGTGEIWINATSLYPSGEILGSDAENEFTEENNFSLMVTLTLGDTRILVTGDAERERIEEFCSVLESSGKSKEYTLVKMPHHGSYNKAIKTLLGTLSPRYAVVCAENNTTVEAQTVTAMISEQAAAYYTYDGTVYFITDGTQNKMVQN